MIATRYDVAHITCLHCIIAITVHQVKGILNMSLVVLRG